MFTLRLDCRFIMLTRAPGWRTADVSGGGGLGKSPLLKAILNEDNLLPTSSSRGCTAAVVELKLYSDLLEPQQKCLPGTTTTTKVNDKPANLYRGDVHFISLQDRSNE